ncbi:hypothetical protein V5P93_002971 [Actinokineospora auranticolor]|uniref:Uncharacterized protein n=2 Tax=Actinokineospora auranticolor TaxID=155976 RepID=A0A2S6H0V2_9PSEU|nr:hypothetical protein CLV40_101297 [Actinokineospora auranticolor]
MNPRGPREIAIPVFNRVDVFLVEAKLTSIAKRVLPVSAPN